MLFHLVDVNKLAVSNPKPVSEMNNIEHDANTQLQGKANKSQVENNLVIHRTLS
jgi:hypothetical protein